MENYGLSIIIPIKVPSISYLEGFADCYNALMQSLDFENELQVLIPNDSRDTIFNEVDCWFNSPNIIHFRPSKDFKIGRNGKLNSVKAALQYVNHELVLLLDDDYRPSITTIRAFKNTLRDNSCLKSMVVYIDPKISDLVNSCGIFFINFTTSHRQFCGHLGFKKKDFQEVGFPSHDVLFDELAIELQFRKAGKKVGYDPNVYLEMITHGLGKFWEQRVRYAYENLAYPLRFIFFLMILPVSILLGVYNIYILLFAVLAMSIMVWAITFIGQKRYARERYPKLTWVYGVIWFWIYPFCTWIALFYFLRGGIKFGDQKVKNAI